jgi:hypothetical protein
VDNPVAEVAVVDSQQAAEADNLPGPAAEVDSRQAVAVGNHRDPEAGSRPADPSLGDFVSRPALLFVIEPVTSFIRLVAVAAECGLIWSLRIRAAWGLRGLLAGYRRVKTGND